MKLRIDFPHGETVFSFRQYKPDYQNPYEPHSPIQIIVVTTWDINSRNTVLKNIVDLGGSKKVTSHISHNGFTVKYY